MVALSFLHISLRCLLFCSIMTDFSLLSVLPSFLLLFFVFVKSFCTQDLPTKTGIAFVRGNIYH